jgi:hypothetical protein
MSRHAIPSPTTLGRSILLSLVYHQDTKGTKEPYSVYFFFVFFVPWW